MGHSYCTVVLAVLLLLLGLLPYCSGIPVRPYQTALSEEDRQVSCFSILSRKINSSDKGTVLIMLNLK